MIKERSYGIIPLRLNRGNWRVLLVQHHSGHWAFPKGHANQGEFPKQTAERELFEETGLMIQHFLSDDPFTENYFFTFQGRLISKTVEYYLAAVHGQLTLQEAEIKDGRWISLSEAHKVMTYKQGKHILQLAIEFLGKNSSN